MFDIRYKFGLDPLQSMAVQGVMTFSLSPANDGNTLLHYSYTVGGYTEQGLTRILHQYAGNHHETQMWQHSQRFR